MYSIKNLPWLAFGIVFLAYSAFGWYLIESIPDLTESLVEKANFLGVSLSKLVIAWTVLPAAAVLIIVLAVSLTAPLLWMRVGIGSWLKSDFKACASILLWSFAVVVIFSWIEYFVRLLVLLSAAILARLELQRAGYKKSQASLLLAGFCLAGFGVGVLASYRWHPTIFDFG